jgi:hypothetical protein
MKTFGLACVVCVAACVPKGPAIPPLPSAGGPAWTELSSEHFVMWTDVPPARGRELVRVLEDHRQVVLDIALGGRDSHAKILAIALRDADEVGAYVPKEFIAYAWGTPNPIRMPVIVFAADTTDENIHIVTHELTHAITFPVVPHQPRWFAEGLAGYFATARLTAARDAVDVGRPLDYIARELATQPRTPIAQLFGCDANPCMDDMFYATTWALFSFFVNNYPQQLTRFMSKFPDLPHDQWRTAWTEAFPGATPDQLDHEMARWLAHGTRKELHYTIKLADYPVAERKLADGDALATRALLRYIFTKSDAETRAALDAALAADKTNLVARLLDAAVAKTSSPDDARATAAAHPDDWRAWWLVGYALQHGPEATDARAKLCMLAATDLTKDVDARLCAGVASPR